MADKYAVFHGLEPGAQYAVQVRAKGKHIDGNDHSAWSDIAIIETDADTTAPDAPTSPVFSSAGGGVYATWTAPVKPADFRDYQVAYYDTASPSASGLTFVDSEEISLSHAQIEDVTSSASNITLEVSSRDTSGNLSSAVSVTGAVVPLDTFDETTHDAHDHTTALGTASIDDLSDVDTSSSPPATGNTLIWGGVNWEPGTASTVGVLDDLTDVDTAGVVNGEALVYNSSTMQWEPGVVATSGGGASATGYVETFGDGSATGYDITHDLASEDVHVQVREYVTGGDDEVVFPTIKIVDTNTVRIEFSSAPATNSHRVVVSLAASGTIAMNDLSDVDTTGITTGQVLEYNGSGFVAGDKGVSLGLVIALS